MLLTLEQKQRGMFNNPLVCDSEVLDNIVRSLNKPSEYFGMYARDTPILTMAAELPSPFIMNVEHYERTRVLLETIKKTTGQKYETVGEYLLSIIPDTEIKQEVEGLLRLL